MGTGLGVLLLWIGMDGIALLMAGLATISTVLLSRIRYHDHRTPDEPSHDTRSFSPARSIRNLLVEWREGLSIFLRDPSVRILLLLISVASVTNVGFITLLPVFALETLGVNEAGVGLIIMTGSIGGLAGALLLGLVPTTIPSRRILQGSLLAGAVLDVAFYGYPLVTGGVLTVSVVVGFLGGLPDAGANATLQTLFQTSVPERMLGRAWGTLGSIQALVMLVATPIVGVLADTFSAQAVLLAITLVIVASWVIALAFPDAPSRVEQHWAEHLGTYESLPG